MVMDSAHAVVDLDGLTGNDQRGSVGDIASRRQIAERAE